MPLSVAILRAFDHVDFHAIRVHSKVIRDPLYVLVMGLLIVMYTLVREHQRRTTISAITAALLVVALIGVVLVRARS